MKNPDKPRTISEGKVRDKWVKKNRYYHKEVKKLLGFLTLKESLVLKIDCSKGEIPAIQLKEEKKYDCIIALDLISFARDIQKTLQQLHRVVRPRSRIVLTYHNYLWEPALKLAEFFRLKRPQPFRNWLASSDIENFLYLAGFDIVKKGERLLIPKYIPFLSVFFNRFLSKLPLVRRFCLLKYFVVRSQSKRQSRKKKPSVSIIIPTRNERNHVEPVVQKTPTLGSKTEIIFVEGGSKDNTLEEIKRVKKKYSDRDIRIFVQDGKGKYNAVRKGFRNAKNDILMILDADMTVRPKELKKFYRAITGGRGEFINGCRLVYPLEKESMRFLNVLGNKFFSLMFSWLLDQRIKDTLCGTKVVWREDYQKIRKGRKFFGDFDPFGDFDLLFGASKLNLKIVDLPVRYHERVYGETNISRFRHGWLLLKMVIFAMRKIKFI